MTGGYGPSTYGERWATTYDDWTARLGLTDTAAAVATLAELAGNGPVLELGIGTGRLALPLVEEGLEVHGIDASPAMLEQLRAKPGSEEISVLLGDFADVDVDTTYSLVFVAFNSFFALGSQEEQARCIANVARCLEDDGTFVIEAFVPDLTRFDDEQTVRATLVDTDRAHVEVSRHDPVNQRVDSQEILFRDGTEPELRPIRIRYAFPSEIDLMARLAALERTARWGSWDRAPFTSASRSHVSVYTPQP